MNKKFKFDEKVMWNGKKYYFVKYYGNLPIEDIKSLKGYVELKSVKLGSRILVHKSELKRGWKK